MHGHGAWAWMLRLWGRIAQPRVQRVSYFVVYVLHVVAGFGIAIAQPRAVHYTMGDLVAYVWAGFLILGGAVAAISVLPGWNYVERLGLLSLMFGIGLTSIFIVANPWQPPGLDVIVWALVTGWVVMFLYRLWETRLYDIAPK